MKNELAELLRTKIMNFWNDQHQLRVVLFIDVMVAADFELNRYELVGFEFKQI